MHRRSWRRLCSKIKICCSFILKTEYRTNVENMFHNSALYVLCIELGRDTGVSLKHFCISRYYCNAFILEWNLKLHVIRPFWSPGSSHLYLIRHFEKHWTPFLWITFGKSLFKSHNLWGLLDHSPLHHHPPLPVRSTCIFGNKWCPVLLDLCDLKTLQRNPEPACVTKMQSMLFFGLSENPLFFADH